MTQSTDNLDTSRPEIRMVTEIERAVLPSGEGPYWVLIGKGQAFGYRKGAVGGVWLARLRGKGTKILGVPPEERYQCDYPVLTFAEAMVAAHLWFEEVHRHVQDPLRTNIGLEPWKPGGPSKPQHPTVGDALDEFLLFHEWRAIKSLSNSRCFHRRIKQAIGHILLRELDSQCLWEWQNDITQPGPEDVKEEGTLVHPFKQPDDPEEGQRWRKKRRIANRLLGYLKTALDRAYDRGWVDSDLAWRRVMPWYDVRESSGGKSPQDFHVYLEHVLGLGECGEGDGSKP